MQYFIGKNFCFPEIGGNATNASCYAILAADFPELLAEISEEEKTDNPFCYRNRIDQTDAPDKPILMLMREPVDRFISRASMNHGVHDVDEIIESLRTGEGWAAESHVFHRQVDYVIKGSTTIFKFPEQLQEFCQAAGFDYPLPKINEANGEKKILTEAQLAFVREYYKADLSLWGSLQD